MSSLSLCIKQKSQQIKQTRDKTLKRLYSKELGELQHQLTLLVIRPTTLSVTPRTLSYIPFDEWKSLSTIGDMVKVLDRPLHSLEEIQTQ